MTRDEFLDIMGKIDEELIDSTLDTSHAKVIKLENKRPPVARYIMSIAACVAALATVFAAGYFKSIPTQPGDASGNTDISYSSPDIIRGWDPEKLAYSNEPKLGGNMRVSVASLDGITAELILHNIKKEAGTSLVTEYADSNSEYMEDATEDSSDIPPTLSDYDYYTNYVGAEDIVLYIHDNKGRRFIETSVTPHSYNGMELIAENCLFEDCTRLYRIEDDYVLMQYADYLNSYLIARFYKIDLNSHKQRDENGIYSGGLTSVEIKSDWEFVDWKYGHPVSREFEYAGEGKFHDSVYQYDMHWNNQEN